jgi:glycosyltransferase involved in cell wall biosynthesis
VGPDNFPPLEAMSVGCPVIAADVPGAHEQYGESVMLFDPSNEEQLADCIARLWNDEGLRLSLVEKGFARAKQWTPTSYAEAMLVVIREFSSKARMWQYGDFRRASLPAAKSVRNG